MVRLTDRPDMTLDVYRGRKTTIQQYNLFRCGTTYVLTTEISVPFILGLIYHKFHDAGWNGKLFCLDETRDRRLSCMLKHGIKVSANYSTHYEQELIHKNNKHRSNTHTLHMRMLHCSRKYKKIKNSKI